MVKTKIICTVGPASRSETTLRKMMLAGMDVARLNFSHGSHARHKESIEAARRLNKKYRRHIRILQDLEGHRIRVSGLKDSESIVLKKGDGVYLTNEDVRGGEGLIPFDYKGGLKDIKTGNIVYIDDGNIALKVISRTNKRLKAEVVVPGTVKANKGINIPDAKLKFKGLVEKDISDIKFGIYNEVDYIAQSFVRTAKDVALVIEMAGDARRNCKIVAKIEDREGIKNIDEIIEKADGVMIARGDMGISLPIYEIPMIQKMIIRKCNKRRRFVITATQMLESMTEHIMPTRAEVTDVANAILDGSDFVMLSGETAIGRYPVETVHMMNRIIAFTERSRKSS